MADRMTNLLAELQNPKLNWITGTVYKVHLNGTCTLTYSGDYVYNVASLDHYSPVEGDTVHALSFEPMGVLIIGSVTNTSGITPDPPVPVTPTIFTSISSGTYSTTDWAWTPGAVQQGPGLMGAWRYRPVDFQVLGAAILQKVEVELTRTSGGPPEMCRFYGDVPAVVAGQPWRVSQIPVGVPTWVPVSICWGQELLRGSTDGIGVISSGQSGLYSGTGRVRLTPLSVTI